MTATQLNTLSGLLTKQNPGYVLSVGAKAEAECIAAGAGALTRPYRDGSVTIFVKASTTQYQMAHELMHLRQWTELVSTFGPEKAYAKWVGLKVLGREQYVYDAMKAAPFWATLTEAERQHAISYILFLGGTQ